MLVVVLVEFASAANAVNESAPTNVASIASNVRLIAIVFLSIFPPPFSQFQTLKTLIK